MHLENDCDILVRYNSFSDGARPHLLDYQNHPGGTQRKVTLIGNYGNPPSSESGWNCAQGQANFSFAYNVFLNDKCSGTGNASVASLNFVDPLSNLHLTAGANAIDKGGTASGYPSTDIDGQPRYSGSAPDAGADER